MTISIHGIIQFTTIFDFDRKMLFAVDIRSNHASAQWPTHPKHGGFGSLTIDPFRINDAAHFVRSSSPKVDLRPLVALKGNYVQSPRYCGQLVVC